MKPEQFIKKHKLSKKDVPRLYEVYLSLMARQNIMEAMSLSLVITLLDEDKILV